ncbi:hypothetical protein PR202_ga16789 [Eleusine coracana subsp. coracana]|uniref:Aspartic peptidase DDI1-type domain-containing protein n=1 Tax=Eleusine coracana subsp. coracana TaxID=191504 RepID=A0AAV5CMC8_ELECO|nr:hypothetical protein PR202_ga16789 [Eleusine coracana subsp. coracana]
MQKLRREVVNFLQEDEESLAEAWTHFQTLLKQGPNLGIDENMCAQTFYMAINKASRMHLDGSARGSFLRLTAKVGIELLDKIAENEAFHKHWEEYLEPNRQCPDVMKKEESPAEQILMSESKSMITSEQFKEIKPVRPASMDLTCPSIGAISEPIGAVATTGEPITLTTPPSSKEYTKIEVAILDNHLKKFEGNFAKPKGDRTLANAKPLDKFEPMDWIPIDFLQELLNMRRSFSPQDASEAGIEYNFPSNRLKSEVFDQEIIGRVLGKLYKDDIELDRTEVKQAKRLLDSCYEPSPYEGFYGVYDVGVTKEEKEETYIPCEISGKKFPKALCDFGSHVSLMTYDAFMSMPYRSQQRLMGTKLELIMADGRKTKPLGVIKNVEIEISSKTMPVDFFVLDNKETGVEDIILGRPFLRLVQAVLDAVKGQITLHLEEEEVQFQFNDPSHQDSSYYQEFCPEEDERIGMDMGDPLDHIMRGTDKYTASADRRDPCADRLKHTANTDRRNLHADRLNQENPYFEPLGELDPDEAAEVEQKKLPKELRYEYLGKNRTYPVIVNNALTKEETERLLVVLKKV